MRLVLISDTHGLPIPQLPPGDVLIHAGDFSNVGEIPEINKFMEWLGEQDYKKIIVVAGNHDFAFEDMPWVARAMVPDNVTYLEDSGTEFEGVKFWGTPWTSIFMDWAFMQTPERLRDRWSLIPQDTNVLITHSPPQFILDTSEEGQHLGSESLTRKVKQLDQLKLHVFGHIHAGHGSIDWLGKKFVNAALLDESYEMVNSPTIIDI
jgi:Icc-related predicted phosphoesterase